MLKFLKSRPNFKVRRSKILISIERSCHEEYKYERPITYHLKDMANVKAFKDYIKLQGQGQEIKSFGTYRKTLS
jgi:hypothetical protein